MMMVLDGLTPIVQSSGLAKIGDIILDIAADALKSDTPDRVYSGHHYHFGQIEHSDV
jgi:hypothetical protein